MTGVIVSRNDRKTKFWLECRREEVGQSVAGTAQHFPEYFQERSKLKIEYGTSDGKVFTPSEEVDLQSVGM